ncbi:MAG: fructose-bisphosphatase class II [Candidatus Zixiibacteriota bacterium]
MPDSLKFNIADQRLSYKGEKDILNFDDDRIIEFNHRHKTALSNYDLILESCQIVRIENISNGHSNLGALRNRKVRQSVILSAALSAMAVGLHGRGSLNNIPKDKVTNKIKNNLKRANDRTAAQIMAEVLQITSENLPIGEEVLIESTITEGVRIKPGKEAGGNPTISVGAVFGKDEHRAQYGLAMPRNVSLMSMGNDVVEGTTKSVKGGHSSMTTLFVTESHVKRHLPDIYVQRWASGKYFSEFNPRETTLAEAAEIIAKSYGYSSVDQLSAFFLERPRHEVAFKEMHQLGIMTPFDTDGDMLPAIVAGLDGLQFPNGRGIDSMIGEIGGSAEWAVGVLPLIWRGGQALGMLTSQSSLTRTDLTPEQKWKTRFNFTEEEYMQIQDARFERKPYFSIFDILEDPFAGGISAFGAITDNYYIPFMTGVDGNPDTDLVKVNVLSVNSLGITECWMMEFKCATNLKKTIERLISPKELIENLSGKELEAAIGKMFEDYRSRQRFKIFFNNEYYPAIIPVRDKNVVLHKALEGLIEREALDDIDREIVRITERINPDWFIPSE